MVAITFKDNYVIMMPPMMSCHWINIGQRAGLIDSVTDEISCLKFLGIGKFVASFLPYHNF